MTQEIAIFLNLKEPGPTLLFANLPCVILIKVSNDGISWERCGENVPNEFLSIVQKRLNRTKRRRNINLTKIPVLVVLGIHFNQRIRLTFECGCDVKVVMRRLSK